VDPEPELSPPAARGRKGAPSPDVVTFEHLLQKRRLLPEEKIAEAK